VLSPALPGPSSVLEGLTSAVRRSKAALDWNLYIIFSPVHKGQVSRCNLLKKVVLSHLTLM
jgi:hypothetical protein